MSPFPGFNFVPPDRQLYELVDLDTDRGPLPVSLAEMKECLKLGPGEHPDDDFLTVLLEASTEDVEKYLGGREIRANTWTVLQDLFCPIRIRLTKTPVDSITSVDRLVLGVFTPVDPADYYLKASQQFAEILLAPDTDWPDDQDEGIEHGVRIVFLTKPHACVSMAKASIKRHVTFMYENRGDCDPANSTDSFAASGAEGLVARVGIKKV